METKPNSQKLPIDATKRTVDVPSTSLDSILDAAITLSESPLYQALKVTEKLTVPTAPIASTEASVNAAWDELFEFAEDSFADEYVPMRSQARVRVPQTNYASNRANQARYRCLECGAVSPRLTRDCTHLERIV